MECLMQFFHFKETPQASFPTIDSTLLHYPQANNNQSLVLSSFDQTQLQQSAQSTSNNGVDSEAACSCNFKVSWQVPLYFVFDGQLHQTVIGGFGDLYMSFCQFFMSKLIVQLLGVFESDLFTKGTGCWLRDTLGII